MPTNYPRTNWYQKGQRPSRKKARQNLQKPEIYTWITKLEIAHRLIKTRKDWGIRTQEQSVTQLLEDKWGGAENAAITARGRQ